MADPGKAEETNESKPFAFLLFVLVVMIFVMPFAAQQTGTSNVLRGLLTLVMLAGVFASTQSRAILGSSVFLAVASSGMAWAGEWSNVQGLAVVAYFGTLTNIIFVACVVGVTILRRECVTADAVFGGLSVFLLIGVAFMIIYGLVEYFQPGSFLVRGEEIRGADSLTREAGSFSIFLYLSFITLATVGFGDILPVQPFAQMMCAAEGIVGQLFLAVIVARLIGMSLASRYDGDGHRGV